MAQLIMMEGPDIGKPFTLSKKNILGTTERSQVRITGIPVNKEWAIIESNNDGYYITPLCGDIQIEGKNLKNTTALNHGDSVKLFFTNNNNELSDITLLFGDEGNEEEFADDTIQDEKATIQSRQRFFKNIEDALTSVGSSKNLQATVNNMQFLVKVTTALSQKKEIKELLPELLDVIFLYLPVDRGTILLKDPVTKKMWPMATKKLQDIEQTEKLMVSKTIIKEVLEKKEGILTQDAMEDDRFQQGLSITSQQIHSAICVPLVRQNEEILGVIHIDTVRSDKYFTKDHLTLMNAVSTQTSIAIENALLLQQVNEKKRLEQEMNIAHDIQQELLPKNIPNCPGLDVYGFMKPAKEVGGDYYDFLVSEDKKKVTIVIGDVSGKGVPAGLVMVMARCFLHSLVLSDTNTRDIMAKMNNFLVDDTRKEMFMSLLIMQWDPEKGVFRWTGGGHEHILVYRQKTKKCEVIRTGGLVLGMLKNANRLFKEQELHLEKGDTILLYTDGVTECVLQENPTKMLDLKGLVTLFEKYGHLSSRQICNAIYEELNVFIKKVSQFDDITLVGIKKL